MATKNISRTIIEGGRRRGNKDDRWDSNTMHRAKNREFSREVKSLVDPDEARVAPKRRVIRKEFDDKLGAAYRWLRSQCGRKWNTVLSELTTMFDTRTTAGRHIIYDHLLGDVCTNLTDRKLFDDRLSNFSWFDFIVDEKGILRLNDNNRWTRRSYRNRSKFPTAKQIDDWTQGRRVMDYGTSIYWMKPKGTAWKACSGYSFYDNCRRHHRAGKERVLVDSKTVLAFEKDKLHQEKNPDGTIRYYREKTIKECLQPVGAFMQDKRFTQADHEMWKKLYEGDREKLLWVLPKSTQLGNYHRRKRH